MKGYLRLRRITEIAQAGVFPNIEQHDGSRADAHASHSLEIFVKEAGAKVKKKEHFGFVLDTPHNRIVNLISQKLCEVSEFTERGWVALDVETYKDLFFAPALRRAEADKPADVEKASLGNQEPPAITCLADILELAPEDQLEALSAAECPAEILAEAAGSIDERLDKKAKKKATDRVKKLQAKPAAPNALVENAASEGASQAANTEGAG